MPHLLEDLKTGEKRFEQLEILKYGEHYLIEIGLDHHLDGKKVCLKRINPEIQDPSIIQNLRQGLARELKHLTMSHYMFPEPLDWLEVQIHDKSEPILVMEWQQGKTLKERLPLIAPHGLSLDRALAITQKLVHFLKELHDQGKVFRNLNDEHVIIGLDDLVYVVGCSNIIDREIPIPEPWRSQNSPYIAPEARTGPCTPASDVYSLGVLLHFMLTLNHPPQPHEGWGEIVQKLDPQIQSFLTALLHPDPQKRLQDMQAVQSHWKGKDLESIDDWTAPSKAASTEQEQMPSSSQEEIEYLDLVPVHEEQLPVLRTTLQYPLVWVKKHPYLSLSAGTTALIALLFILL